VTKHHRRVGGAKGLNMSKNPVVRAWFSYTKSLYLDLGGECEDRGLSPEDVVSVSAKWAMATVTMRDGTTFTVELWGDDDHDYRHSDGCYVESANGADAGGRVDVQAYGFRVKSESDDDDADANGA
jgi:hypothetical protein